MNSGRSVVSVIRSVAEPARHYVGVTSDLDARLAAHNAGRSFHTSKHAPWRLVVRIDFDDTLRAFAFEKYLKSGSGRAFMARHFL